MIGYQIYYFWRRWTSSIVINKQTKNTQSHTHTCTMPICMGRVHGHKKLAVFKIAQTKAKKFTASRKQSHLALEKSHSSQSPRANCLQANMSLTLLAWSKPNITIDYIWFTVADRLEPCRKQNGSKPTLRLQLQQLYCYTKYHLYTHLLHDTNMCHVISAYCFLQSVVGIRYRCITTTILRLLYRTNFISQHPQ